MVTPEWRKSKEVRFNLKVSPSTSRSWKEWHGLLRAETAQAESETRDLQGGEAREAGSPAHKLSRTLISNGDSRGLWSDGSLGL